MKKARIPLSLRRGVSARAGEQCEYCLYPQAFSFATFEMEHIIAEKHRGQTVSENLALACQECNGYKGTDLGSIDALTNQFSFFYNPRKQVWNEHFQMEAGVIIPLTAEGRVTVHILQFNQAHRVEERRRLSKIFDLLKTLD